MPPVRTNGPLASAPYIGTDNIAAGKAMAQKVTAEKVAVFAAINSPGIERATAFKELKPEAEVFRVGENSSKDVLAAMDKFDDFVFLNGNSLVGSLAMLLAAGKHVYTFDVYAEFLDVLMTGSPSLKGVMAQNTFAMARKAVETVLADSGRQGEMVPTFYITTSNLDADEVQPFLEFYGRQVTPFNLAEKIIGKWEFSDKDGKEVLTNEKMVFSFVSPTKAYVSFSIDERESTWADHVEADVKINGNKVTLTFHTGEDNTSVHELAVTAINGTMLSASQKVTVTMGGTVIITDEFACRFTKVNADYSEKILGLWECQGISGGETFNDANGRLEFLADGTYRFYRYNDNGQWEMVTTREYQDYFVDGTLVATLWMDVDGEELREWWQITTIAENDMVWIGQRQDETGVPAAAMELSDGTIITSKTTALLGPSAALILNATKYLAGIDHNVKLIAQNMIEPIQKTKVDYLHGNNPRLHTDEVLVALSILSQQDDNCRKALEMLPELRGCQVHCTVLLSEVDRKIFRKLGVGLTCDPVKKKYFAGGKS